jgi:nucleotide-binding universal stress UspA family protein
VIAKHILVPTDFSPHADCALAYAIELAATLQAHLTVLHVFHLSPLTVGEVPPAAFNDILRDIEREYEFQISPSGLNSVSSSTSTITTGRPRTNRIVCTKRARSRPAASVN